MQVKCFCAVAFAVWPYVISIIATCHATDTNTFSRSLSLSLSLLHFYTFICYPIPYTLRLMCFTVGACTSTYYVQTCRHCCCHFPISLSSFRQTSACLRTSFSPFSLSAHPVPCTTFSSSPLSPSCPPACMDQGTDGRLCHLRTHPYSAYTFVPAPIMQCALRTSNPSR